MNGLLVINKPLNFTSMDMIRTLRKITGIQKIGHAGTLDPLATGILLVCFGKTTKNIASLMEQTKEYRAIIDLSAFSETDDAQGPLTSVNVTTPPTRDAIKTVLKNFIGTIQQVPPQYSAIKVNGVRAYTHARAGQKIDLSARSVKIDAIELIDYHWPHLDINVTCGKGTYIRSLARDIGTTLNTGGYITSLTRTAVGSYTLDKALGYENLNRDTIVSQIIYEPELSLK